jgi:hypothetical protein
MRIFDLIIQTLLFLLSMLALAFGKEGYVWILIFQFFMGCWQLLSALICSVRPKTETIKKRMIIYWSLVLGYFIVLGLLAASGMNEMSIIWFFSAWGIAVYYYVFTFQLVINKENSKKSFLDVVN